MSVNAAVRLSPRGGTGSAAAEALRVIRAAKQYRHGPAALLTSAPAPPHSGRYEFIFPYVSLTLKALLVLIINTRLYGN